MLEQHFTWLMNKSYSHVHELLHLYSPSPSLHSASDTRISCVPRVCRRTLGERSFQYIGPVIWNSLSFSVRHATSLSSFKSKLKTYLFSSAYWFLAFFLLFPSNPWLLCLCFYGVCVCVCVCVCVRVRVGVWGCLWVCACGCGMLICFVSALGSHEMGRHKLPIIILLFLLLLAAVPDLQMEMNQSINTYFMALPFSSLEARHSPIVLWGFAICPNTPWSRDHTMHTAASALSKLSILPLYYIY